MVALPATIVVAAVIWILLTPWSAEGTAALIVVLISTIILRQLSNSLQLIRVRSWAVSSVFVLLAGVCYSLHQWSLMAAAMGLLYLIHITGLLYSYQAKRPQNHILLAFIALSLMTMAQPAFACLLPVSIMAMAVHLRTLTAKSFVAIFFGLLLPYEVWAAWHIYNGTIAQALTDWGTQFTDFAVPQIQTDGPLPDLLYANLWQQGRLAIIVLFIYGLIGLFHFIRTSYNDKISTRMHYYTIILQWPVLMALLVFMPTHTNLMAPPLIMAGSPILAHYMVFAKGWAGNLFFWLFIALCLFLVLPIF